MRTLQTSQTFREVAAPHSRQNVGLCADRLAYLAALSSQSRAVAHIGCTDAPFTEARLRDGLLLHERLLSVNKEVVGVDVDANGLRVLSGVFPNAQFSCADYSSDVSSDHIGAFDLVLCPEVIEHVPDPRSLLLGCRRVLRPDGCLCVTAPNACSPKPALRALLGYEVVHPDHYCYYSARTLERLLDASGFSVTAVLTYLSYQPSRPGALFNVLLRLGHLARRGPIGDGLIVLAKPRAAAASL